MIVSLITYTILVNKVLSDHIEVFKNDWVYLNCKNSLVDIQWHFNSLTTYVYAGRRLVNGFRHFQLNGTNLIIPNITLENAGWYYCSKETTGTRINSIQLTVLEKNPICSSNMYTYGFTGPNLCNIQSDIMVFNCEIKFNGGPPQLKWISTYDGRMYNSSSCNISSNRISCNLNLLANSFYDESVFICQVGLNENERYRCKLQKIKIQYILGNYMSISKQVHDTVTCAVTSNNLHIGYEWILRHNDNTTTFLTSNSSISIGKSETHQCNVKYTIKNVTCTFLVTNIKVIQKSTVGSDGLNIITAIVISIVSITLTGLVVVSLFYGVKQLRNKVEEPLPTNRKLLTR